MRVVDTSLGAVVIMIAAVFAVVVVVVVSVHSKQHTAVQHCAAQVKALSGKAVKCRQRLVKQRHGCNPFPLNNTNTNNSRNASANKQQQQQAQHD